VKTVYKDNPENRENLQKDLKVIQRNIESREFIITTIGVDQGDLSNPVEAITKMISSELMDGESDSESNSSSQRTVKKTFTIKTSV
jgi:hypothetical protein